MKIYQTADEIKNAVKEELLTPHDVATGPYLAVLWNICYQLARIGDCAARAARRMP